MNIIKTLAIIPARAGSKRLPSKNIKPLAGKPLVAWTVEQACSCEYFSDVIVSTDCQSIADIAQTYGAEVPFLRPAALSDDTASSIAVVEHALNHFARQGKTFDYIALLEPTSPLRKKEDLNQAMRTFLENSGHYHAMVSVGKIEREHPAIIKAITPENRLLPYAEHFLEKEAYFPYGVIYASKVSTLLATKTFYQPETLPYFIERWQNFEIDDEVDFLCTESLLQKYRDFL